MKEQGKNPPDLTSEEEIGSLPEKELRVMKVKMIQNLGNRMEKIQENGNTTEHWNGILWHIYFVTLLVQHCKNSRFGRSHFKQ